MNYYSLGSFPGDAVPEPVGHAALDVSPFGVRDLAGSVAEITSELYGPLPGEYLLLGGSFRSVDPEELSIETRRRLANEPRPDVGFRVVARPLDPWFRQPDRPPEPFEDRFQRPGGSEVGGGWWETARRPGSLRTRADEGLAARLEAPGVLLQGGQGNFSEAAQLWHRIHVGAHYRVSGRAWVSIAPEYRETRHASRQFHVSLVRGATEIERGELSLRWTGRGETTIAWGGVLALSDPQVSNEVHVVPGEAFEFELVVRGEVASGRVVGADGRVQPLGPLQLPPASETGEPFRPRYLVLGAPALVGGRLELEWIRVEPLP